MDEIKILKKQQLQNNHVNLILAEKKGLLIKDGELYLKIQSLYQKAFDQYLLNKIDLGKYDNALSTSSLGFGKMPVERRNEHHLISSLHLEYIYVRNFFYIEKLSDSVLLLLKERITEGNYQIDQTLLQIVEGSYKEVMVDNFRHGQYKQDTTTCYGHLIPANIVSSRALVFVIQYGKNVENLSKEDFKENQKQKDEFLKQIAYEIETTSASILGVEIKVLIRNFVGE